MIHDPCRLASPAESDQAFAGMSGDHNQKPSKNLKNLRQEYFPGRWEQHAVSEGPTLLMAFVSATSDREIPSDAYWLAVDRDHVGRKKR
ncbi:hypothetical protein [Telmatospirillum siberiense]|uniref:hypothetical protein n=1 Tax=Telmatospirillum siberiense TaxID=382514 RepID=UPI0011AFA736|nr:hypothetical protein [Telmatospirillum siberiense]